MPEKFNLPIIGAQSRHEMDFHYLSDVTGQSDLVHFATAAGVAIQRDMTNFARSYRPSGSFIADKIAPIIQVQSESGRYTAFGQEVFDISVSDQLADDANPNSIVFTGRKISYNMEPRGLRTFVSNRVTREEGPLRAGMRATSKLMHQLMLRQEARVRNLADATLNTTTPPTNWDTSTAINTDVLNAAGVVDDGLGDRATHIVFRPGVADAIVGNANTTSNIAAASSVSDGRAYLGMLDGQTLPETTNAWGLRVTLAGARYITSAPGALVVKGSVWGNDAYLIRVDDSPETNTWAVQFNLLNPIIVTIPDIMRGVGGIWYKIFYQRVVKEITPEAIHKLVAII